MPFSRLHREAIGRETMRHGTMHRGVRLFPSCAPTHGPCLPAAVCETAEFHGIFIVFLRVH